MSHDNDWDEVDCEDQSTNSTPASETVDYTNLKLDVERIQYRWNAEESRYDTVPDDGATGDAGEPTPKAPTHAFVIARKFEPTDNPNVFRISKKLHIWSPYFYKVARKLMEPYTSIAWSKPLKLKTDDFLPFISIFEKHVKELEATQPKEGDDAYETIRHTNFLLELVKKEHASKLQALASLLSEQQITFEYVWGIFTPGTLLLAHCDTTGEPLALRLKTCTLNQGWSTYWELSCEYVDVSGGLPGLADYSVQIQEFSGAESIMDLPVFPMHPYLGEARRKELCEALTQRGKRYWELSETWCHKDYDGVANHSGRKIAVKSRIMLDKEKYSRYGYLSVPNTSKTLDGQSLERKALTNKTDVRRVDMTDEEYMLFPARMWGFSLADRKWMTFNVESVRDIHWNLEAFDHLDIPSAKKEIVKVLIESHTRKAAEFDDFVPGKGRGLIFALHGPPGVGKTLTAEATSEVARAPLYMVGAGDLGTSANELDSALTTLLDLASDWKAIVLIDEADVFLERRDVHDLLRNAMVAVFLRQLEYYTGILILTTNRLSIIDPAMKSRIHVSLMYEPLNTETRTRLWHAFLEKAGLQEGEKTAVDADLMTELASRSLNGREIKNVIKTATTFAAYHGRKVDIHDVLKVVGTVDDMEEILS